MIRFLSAAAARAPKRALSGLVVPVALLLGACDTIKDDLLTVPDVDVARPSALVGLAALPTLRASAISEFTLAYSGSSGTEGAVTMSGLFTDELQFAESFPTRVQWDQRVLDPVNTSTGGVFRQMLRARAVAKLANERYVQYAANDPNRTEVLNLLGLSYLLVADVFCSGVPFSTLDDAGNTIFGQPLTRAQMLDSAKAAFDSAIAVGTRSSATTQTQLARLGRARVQWSLGDLTGAVGFLNTPTPIAATFAYNVLHSANSSRQWNGIWNFAANQRRWSVANGKGGVGLAYITGGDPRVRATRRSGSSGIGFDNVTPLFIPNIHPDRASPAVVGNGVEAELIRAEAEAVAGNANYLTRLNTLRANTALYACPTLLAGCTAPTALAALTDPGTAEGRIRQVYAERAFWLYLTAHRIGDMRRLIRPVAQGGYGYAANTVWPNGAYPLGGSYGTEVNFSIPLPDERNNPNFTGQCLDRNP